MGLASGLLKLEIYIAFTKIEVWIGPHYANDMRGGSPEAVPFVHKQQICTGAAWGKNNIGPCLFMLNLTRITTLYLIGSYA